MLLILRAKKNKMKKSKLLIALLILCISIPGFAIVNNFFGLNYTDQSNYLLYFK